MLTFVSLRNPTAWIKEVADKSRVSREPTRWKDMEGPKTSHTNEGQKVARLLSAEVATGNIIVNLREWFLSQDSYRCGDGGWPVEKIAAG